MAYLHFLRISVDSSHDSGSLVKINEPYNVGSLLFEPLWRISDHCECRHFPMKRESRLDCFAVASGAVFRWIYI